jgi:hypothetical protein
MFIYILSCFSVENSLPEQPAPDLDPTVQAALDETRRAKQLLEVRMLEVVVEAENIDQTLGLKARTHFNFFHDHFASAVVGGFQEDHRAWYVAEDACQAEPCYQFVIAEIKPIGMWAIPSYDLVLKQGLDPADDFAMLVVFHELHHASNEKFWVESGESRLQSELDAFAYEAELVNAMSHGQYRPIMDALVVDVAALRVERLHFNGLTIAPVPEVFGQTFPNVGRWSMAAINALYLVDLNRTLIANGPMTAEEKRREELKIYDRVNTQIGPEQTDFMRRSIAAWKHPWWPN